MVLGALGLLCVLLLAVVLALSAERSQFSSTLTNCSSERDLLQTQLKTLQEKNTNISEYLFDWPTCMLPNTVGYMHVKTTDAFLFDFMVVCIICVYLFLSCDLDHPYFFVVVVVVR